MLCPEPEWEQRMECKIAIVQKPPAVLDSKATLQRAVADVGAAAAAGARLIVFPEAYLPGYPSWIWRLRPGRDMKLGNEIHSRLRANAIDIGRGDLEPLCRAAAQLDVTVICGLNEVDSAFSGTTLFNAVVTIGPDGNILNRHRKLMPTNPERMVWGGGDGRGLNVVATPAGRIGTLMCWESYMPLARYALYAQKLDIYVAPTWDCGETWLASLRHIAREGGCWVLATGTAIQAGDMPPDFPGREQLFGDPEEWLCDGDAVVVRPGGSIAAGPLHRDKGVLHAVVDSAASSEARKSLDVAGHYARPDIFRLQVDRRPMPPVDFIDGQRLA
jgi:nitrilase